MQQHCHSPAGEAAAPMACSTCTKQTSSTMIHMLLTMLRVPLAAFALNLPSTFLFVPSTAHSTWFVIAAIACIDAHVQLIHREGCGSRVLKLLTVL
jgi:hypothetical protein